MTKNEIKKEKKRKNKINKKRRARKKKLIEQAKLWLNIITIVSLLVGVYLNVKTYKDNVKIYNETTKINNIQFISTLSLELDIETKEIVVNCELREEPGPFRSTHDCPEVSEDFYIFSPQIINTGNNPIFNVRVETEFKNRKPNKYLPTVFSSYFGHSNSKNEYRYQTLSAKEIKTMKNIQGKLYNHIFHNLYDEGLFPFCFKSDNPAECENKKITSLIRDAYMSAKEFDRSTTVLHDQSTLIMTVYWESVLGEEHSLTKRVDIYMSAKINREENYRLEYKFTIEELDGFFDSSKSELESLFGE